MAPSERISSRLRTCLKIGEIDDFLKKIVEKPEKTKT
jgi:hypothetical protein